MSEENYGMALATIIFVGVQAFFLVYNCSFNYHKKNPSATYQRDGIEEKVTAEYA